MEGQNGRRVDFPLHEQILRALDWFETNPRGRFAESRTRRIGILRRIVALARRFAVINLAATHLQIGITDIRVTIQRGFLDDLVGRQESRAFVDVAQGDRPVARGHLVDGAERIGLEIDTFANGVSTR